MEQRQYVGIDLHRRRSVIVRMDATGEVVGEARIFNEPLALAAEVAKAGPAPEVAIEATFGWYWAVDVLEELGARVHLAHPLAIKAFENRRVKNDRVDAYLLADVLRMGRLPEAWIAPRQTRELRELVRYRHKPVYERAGLKAQVHAVLAKEGVGVPMSDFRELLEVDPFDKDQVSLFIRQHGVINISWDDARLLPIKVVPPGHAMTTGRACTSSRSARSC